MKRNPARYVDSFDIAIYLYRQNRDLTSFPEYAATQHQFVYTDFMQNWYRSPGNKTTICAAFPGTFLLHGRNIAP